jgi:hypothetical protein
LSRRLPEEDCPQSSFRHYAIGAEGRIEIESEWTARKRERAEGTLRPAAELLHPSQKPGLNESTPHTFVMWKKAEDSC